MKTKVENRVAFDAIKMLETTLGRTTGPITLDRRDVRKLADLLLKAYAVTTKLARDDVFGTGRYHDVPPTLIEETIEPELIICHV